MDRTAHLIEASVALRRKIWASLPFSLRMADFFSRLAVSTTEAFGKAVYAEFLTHGVEGMPDINGRSASEFDISRKPVANRLPHDYGRAFGKKAYANLMGRLHNPEVAEDVMSNFLVGFLVSGSDHIRPGASLRDAENYVLTALHHDASNALRSWLRGEGKEVSDVYQEGEDDGGRKKYRDIPVSVDEASMEKELKRILPRVTSKLNAIHPDGALYIKLSLVDGYTDREILGDEKHGVPSLLTHPYNRLGRPLTQATWEMDYKDRIFKVLKDAMKDPRREFRPSL